MQINGEVTPFPVGHNVVNGQWATKDCATCHNESSVLAASFALADYTPGGQLPRKAEFPGIGFSGDVANTTGGGVDFVADNRAAGFYVIGLHGEDWVDLVGLLMFLGITLGVSGHAVAR